MRLGGAAVVSSLLLLARSAASVARWAFIYYRYNFAPATAGTRHAHAGRLECMYSYVGTPTSRPVLRAYEYEHHL